MCTFSCQLSQLGQDLLHLKSWKKTPTHLAFSQRNDPASSSQRQDSLICNSKSHLSKESQAHTQTYTVYPSLLSLSLSFSHSLSFSLLNTHIHTHCNRISVFLRGLLVTAERSSRMDGENSLLSNSLFPAIPF